MLTLEDIRLQKAIFFNGSIEIPKIMKPKIRITMSSSPFNPTIPYDYRNTIIFQGAYLALDETNQSTEILENFELEPHEIACSATEDN